MVSFYDINHIKLEEPKYYGHTVYPYATYQTRSGAVKKIVYKQNKHADLNYSRFEVGLSAVASRFLLPGLTPRQLLVKDGSGRIVGVASEHYCYTAARREGDAVFCSLRIDRKGNPIYRQIRPTKAEDIPVYFLDQFPPGFFAALLDRHKRREIDFDMASLASVLTTSYSLEEDDLHKGNFGFYLVRKGDRRVVVFFKIDNDLMLTDSLMSTYGSRMTSWSNDDHAFDVTARDIKSFPKLVDSQNHYWPTSRRYLTKPSDSKVYSGFKDIPAFKELAKSKAFRYAQWREFYKQILIPPQVIEEELKQGFDINDANERAHLMVAKHAVVARQAKLRAVLFSIPEFRSFIRRLPLNRLDCIRREILGGMADEPMALFNGITTEMKRHRSLCATKGGFAAGDTPLHVAIRLGDYRYHETWHAFGHFAEMPNKRGEKPLDVAVALAKQSEPHSFADPRQDPFYTINKLLQEGVARTKAYRHLTRSTRQAIVNYTFTTHYLSRAKNSAGVNAFLRLMRDLGEDERYSLKMRKELAIYCLKQFIRAQRNAPAFVEILQEIKTALNGNDERDPAPELQYIRQLRSRWWIIRQIRGLLGGTSTQLAMNNLIDNELSGCGYSCSPCFSFFSSRKETGVKPVDDLEQLNRF